MENKDNLFAGILGLIEKQKIILQKLIEVQEHFEGAKTTGDKNKSQGKIINFKKDLSDNNEKVKTIVSKINLASKLVSLGYRLDATKEEKERDKEESKNYYDKDLPLRSKGGNLYTKKELSLHGLEKETVKRIRSRNKKKVKKKGPVKKSSYAKVSSILFSSFSKSLLGKESFQKMEKDLIKGNLDYSPTGYLSVILFTTLLSFFVGGFLFFFFLFFNVGSTFPMITRAAETINIRLLKVFWILFAVPIGTFLTMYSYPHLEKRATESKIDQELPFATIHMSAISGSMIDPVKIFEIIVNTGEYPALQKEFTKLLNEINLYGSDFVNALQNSARNSASKKLGELYNGLSTNINSGGDLPNFFEKRAETLLFDHQIAVQKEGKSAETFMDVYISLVIAAPMILMILLMMMKLSGIGLSLSVSLITLIMILIVAAMNVMFLMFLHMKKKKN
jgi:hypothetical protein